MVSRLADLDLFGVDSVFIDELHFFEDAVEFCAHCIANGISVKATTLHRDLVGNPMPLPVTLEVWEGVTVTKLHANCDTCGTIAAADFTKRTCLGASYVGGKEEYASCCRRCFEWGNLYLDPSLWVINPELFFPYITALESVTGLNP